MPVGPPNRLPPPPPARAAATARTTGLPGDTAEAVVAEHQRPDAVVRRAGDPRSVRRGRERHEHGPGEAGDRHRGTAGEQLAQRPQAAARRVPADPHPGERDARDDHQRDAHLRLEAEADGDPAQHEPLRAAGLERAHGEPQRRDAAEHEQLVRVVVARDGDCGRGDGERQAADEPGETAEAPADEVVDEHRGRDAHQRLRHEQAERVIAEDPRRQRLDPQAERRLVDRHQSARVHRREQEVVPARAHRAHGGAVVRVGPAVDGEAPEVEDRGNADKAEDLRPRDEKRPDARHTRGHPTRVGAG